MCTVVPTLTGLIGLIPKFFYDLSGEKRERMYRELHERRQAVIDEMKVVSDKIKVDTDENEDSNGKNDDR